MCVLHNIVKIAGERLYGPTVSYPALYIEFIDRRVCLFGTAAPLYALENTLQSFFFSFTRAYAYYILKRPPCNSLIWTRSAESRNNAAAAASIFIVYLCTPYPIYSKRRAGVSDLDRYPPLRAIKGTSSTVYKNARIVHCHREVTLYHICPRVPNWDMYFYSRFSIPLYVAPVMDLTSRRNDWIWKKNMATVTFYWSRRSLAREKKIERSERSRAMPLAAKLRIDDKSRGFVIWKKRNARNEPAVMRDCYILRIIPLDSIIIPHFYTSRHFYKAAKQQFA